MLTQLLRPLRPSGALLLGLALAVGCGNDPGPEPDTTNPADDFEQQDTDQYSATTLLAAGSGDAQLKRYSDRLELSGLVDTIPDTDSYTVWWAIFNKPEDCMGVGNDDIQLCDGDLLGGADFAGAQANVVDAAFGFCDSFVIERFGEAGFTCTRTIAEGDFAPDADGNGALSGLFDPENAEVHIIVRSHGATLTGEQATEQLSAYMGGCDTGDGNEGLCEDVMYFPFRGVDCVPTHGVICP